MGDRGCGAWRRCLRRPGGDTARGAQRFPQELRQQDGQRHKLWTKGLCSAWLHPRGEVPNFLSHSLPIRNIKTTAPPPRVVVSE